MTAENRPTAPALPPQRSSVRRWTLPALEQVCHRRPGQEWIPHWHAEWTVGAIVQGECQCSVAGTPVRARAGDVLAIAPHTVHTGALRPVDGADHVAVVMLYVDAGWLQTQGLPLPRGSGFLHRPALAAAAAALETPAAIAGWLHAALPELAAGLPADYTQRTPTAAARQALAALQAATDDHPLAIAELAAACGISRERLHRVIRRWTGMSPSAYLRALRVHKAREMLFDRAPLADIASACGFADQAHFTRAFRQSFGYTPGDLLAALE